ncbi:hypothetical protein [Bifidobacterium longum]|nr:hypothetical protein [Bifidobacterium longum]
MGAPTGKVGQPKEEGTPMNTTAKSKIGLLGKSEPSPQLRQP